MCSFLYFSPICFEILSWHFADGFLLMYDRLSSSVVSLHPPGSPSVHPFSALASYMHWQLSWKFNLTFVSLMGFFRKVLYKNSLLKCSWRAYYAPFAVLRYYYTIMDFLEGRHHNCQVWKVLSPEGGSPRVIILLRPDNCDVSLLKST